MSMLAIAAMGNVAFSLALGGLAALCASEKALRDDARHA
jgi:hypothetical protein